MSLKSRLQKSREKKTFSFTDTDCDLLAFFEAHADIEAISAYGHDRIFGEKNGVLKKLSLSFPTKDSYLSEIKKIASLHNISLDEENPHVIINTSENTQINIYIPPLVASEPFVSFTRRTKPIGILQEKLISDEILLYISECLEKKANIFVAGNTAVDKISIMNIIADLQDDDKKLIVCENGASLKLSKPCVATFSKDLLKNSIGFNYDNIFCPETNVDDLVNIFRLVISGCSGFVVSLSVKSNVEILSAVRNMILLSNINLFEENADFLATSAMDVVLTVEKTENNSVRITKVSEMSKNMKNEIVLKDIFVWNKNSHISTGNQSKFFNFENSKKFKPELFEEGYKHNYVSEELYSQNDIFNVTPSLSTDNFENSVEEVEAFEEPNVVQKSAEDFDAAPEFSKMSEIPEVKLTPQPEVKVEEEVVSDKKSKLKKLKEKIKRDKLEVEKAPITVEKEPIEEEKTEEENELLAELAKDAEDFSSVDKFDKPTETNDFVQPAIPNILEDVEDEDSDETEEVSSNEGLLASETDDFSDEPPKIKNILEDYDDEEDSNEPETIDGEVINESIEDVEDEHADLISENEEQIEEENILSKYENAQEEAKTPIDPELFEEIKNVNVDDYSDDDLTDIPDSDI